MKIKKINENDNSFQLEFICPGCNAKHIIDNTLNFNNNYEFPSISPSILINGYGFDLNKNTIIIQCHSLITKGKIKFFSDCNHKLAGQKLFDLINLE